MVGLTWATWLTSVETALKRSASDANFMALQGPAVDYAEQRICRELELLTQVASDSSGTTTPFNPSFTFPSFFVIAQEIVVFTPAGSTMPATATGVPLTQTSKEYIRLAWPSAAGAAVPEFWAPITDQLIVLGPWPNAAYTLSIIGLKRPAPLSASNTTTWISQYLPDLFLMATLIFFSGDLQGNFSATSDDPQGPMSYEKQYQMLSASAKNEETRKRFGANLALTASAADRPGVDV